MRVLLVNPECPNSYWSGRYALSFVQRRSFLPPLALVTVAALLPRSWTYRLVDLNVRALSDEEIRWADVVMLTGMLVQRASLQEVLARCQRLGVRTVVGGPYTTALPAEMHLADHVVVGEGEELIPALGLDLEMNRARPLYEEKGKPDLTRAPLPRFDLIDPRDYHRHNMATARNTSTVNMLDQCAVTMPVALDAAGMPAGLHILCPLGADETAFVLVASPRRDTIAESGQLR